MTARRRLDPPGSLATSGVFLAVGSAIAYGVGPAIAKPLLAVYSPWLVLAMRFLAAGIVAWIAVSVSPAARHQVRRIDSAELGRVALSSLALVVVAGASYFALARLPATLVILIAYTYPAMAALVSRWFGAPISLPIAALSFGLAITGVVLVSGGANGSIPLDPAGLAAAVLVPVATAVFMLLQGRVAGERKGATARQARAFDGPGGAATHPLPSTVVTALVTSATGCAFAVVTIADGGTSNLAIPTDALLRIALLGVAAAAAIALAYEATTRIGVAATSLVSLVEVAVVVTTAAIFLGEQPTIVQLIGVLFVAASVPITVSATRRVADPPGVRPSSVGASE